MDASSTDNSDLGRFLGFNVWKNNGDYAEGEKSSVGYELRQFLPDRDDAKKNQRIDCVEDRSVAEEQVIMAAQHQQWQLRRQQVTKSRRGPRSRSSQYRGVTFYRRTGRWESHIWACGKQVYLGNGRLTSLHQQLILIQQLIILKLAGGFDTAHAAARAYDLAAIKFRGLEADINFEVCDYEDDLKQIKDLTTEEFVHVLRRQSTGFSRGASKYRGVTLHKCGRWEARMGQYLGKKYIYLGLFDSEIEAARAYDKAAIKFYGREALTNFEPAMYDKDPDSQGEKQQTPNSFLMG
ncbi:hypothetical protein M569_07960 [Genlisea aurea]|uniref:AP2/ERF domain-containing protein n=1 Tax=Genlisea aurea TaxID=192259 RepID=S8CJA6_9LAMI|nr:hypothetical protein M569_07960 [Genlisea aurea]